MRGRALSMAAAIGCCAAGVLFACGDDDTVATSPPDGGTPEAGGDTGGGSDAGTDVISPNDAGDADAGPMVTTSLGAAGTISVFSDLVIANLREDDTILRVSNAPECVAHIYSSSKPQSSIGNLTIGGAQIVGVDGGLPAPAVIAPMQDVIGFTYLYPGPAVFPPTAQVLVEVSAAGTASAPALPIQSVRTPPTAPVAITKPTEPDGGAALVAPSTQPFDVTWTAPAGQAADQRVIVDFIDLTPITPMLGKTKNAAVRCAFPLAQGKGTIPANLLAELKQRQGGDVAGLLTVLAGGQKEATPGGASYVIEVSRLDSTSLSLTPLTVEIH